MGKKKMYKSNDRKVCGVCGGLAEYFGIDPTLVRLITVLLLLGGGISIWIYIIAALIMPKVSTQYDVPYHYDDNMYN